MAILSNLVVHGASRFLNTAYFNDVSISGTASLASLSLSGNLSVTGTSTLTGHTTIGSYNNTSYSLSASSAIINSWIRTTGQTGWYNQSYGGGWYMADANYVRSYGKPVMMGHNLYFGNDSRYINTSGDAVLNSINNATDITTNNLNVANNLHATHFDLQTVAQLGGSFYVSPTVKFPNSGTTLGVAKSGTTLTLTITDSSITSTTMAGIVWSANSRVKVSGTINGVVTGTMDGTVSSINTSSHVLTLSVSGENSGSVVAGTYSASQFSDLSVMVYQRRVVDGSTNNDYRVGIWMNCYDIANSSATIRVYGGTSSAPNVLLGNLTNAGLGTVNGITPSGWGLYAQNAFLWGAIVSTEGQIGGWTIGEDKLYNGTDSLTSTTPGTYIGAGATAATSGIRNYKDANTFVNITGGVITAKAVDLTGKITATSGSIAGWRIESTYLASGSATAPGANVLLLSPAGTVSSYTVAGKASSGWTITSGANFGVTKTGAIYANDAHLTGEITATSGYIGGTSGWTIASQQLSNGTLAADNSMYLATKNLGSNTTIAGRSGSDWRFTVGSNFGVTNTGATYASTLVIGPSNGYHATVADSAFKVYNNTTLLSSFGATTTIGRTDSTNRNIYIDANGVSIRSGTTVLSNFATDITLGRVASGYRNIFIDADSGILIRKNDTVLANFGDTITIGETGTSYNSSIQLTPSQFSILTGAQSIFFLGTSHDPNTTAQGFVQEIFEGDMPTDYITPNPNDQNDKYYYITQIPENAYMVEVTESTVGKVNFVEVEGTYVGGIPYKKIYAQITTSYSGTYTYYDYGTIYMSFGNNDYSNATPGMFSFTNGTHCLVYGKNSVCIGQNSIVLGNNCIAAGDTVRVTHNDSAGFGKWVTASGENSFAAGASATASGDRSCALGYRANASGTSSFAFGAQATASATNSVAIGRDCSALSRQSIAIGDNATVAANSGTNLVAIGTGVESNANSYFTIGRFNGTPLTGSIFTIGNGTSESDRSNALTLDQDGNLWTSGHITATKLGGLNSSGNAQIGTTSRPTTANNNYADNCLRYYLATSSMTTGKPSNDAHIIHMPWDGGAWDTQLALVHNTSKPYLQIRSEYGTENTWSSWATVLDSNNYNSYAPTKTGTGASGTWGISITGNVKTHNGSSYVPVGSGSNDGEHVAIVRTNAGVRFVAQGQFNNSKSYSAYYVNMTSSDIRLKENIKDTSVTDALSVVNKMKIREFDWKCNEPHQKIGFIADELEELDSNLTLGGGYDEDGEMIVKSIDTLPLNAYMVKAIQELSAKVEEQAAEIERLKAGR